MVDSLAAGPSVGPKRENTSAEREENEKVVEGDVAKALRRPRVILVWCGEFFASSSKLPPARRNKGNSAKRKIYRLLDTCKSVAYVTGISESVVSGFNISDL